jgi:hypothetical protein
LLEFAVSTASRFVASAALVVAVLGACGGGAAPTAAPTGTLAATSQATIPPTTSAGADFAAVCRHLANLTDLDYAFGKSFTNVSSLDAAGKAQTLKDVQAFAAEAPPELSQAATDLVGLWTDLVNNPQSVTESDPRWAEATNSISAWRTANCPSA